MKVGELIKMLQHTVTTDHILMLFRCLYEMYTGDSFQFPDVYSVEHIKPILSMHDNMKEKVMTFEGIETETRIKSKESLKDKLQRHLNDGLLTKFVCNDWIGIRVLVDKYTDIPVEICMEKYKADFSHQHSNGYNAIHAYLYNGYKYPIEIQFHTPFDYRFNMWNREHNYKKIGRFGLELRDLYLRGKLETEKDYLDALNHFYINGYRE